MHEVNQNATGHGNIQVANTQGDVHVHMAAKVTCPLHYPKRDEHFTGREAELKELLAEIRPNHVATRWGTGGMGKTTLVAEAVWRLKDSGVLAEQFPDGLFFHTFYNQPSVDVVLESICRAWGVEPRGDLFDSARHVLGGKRALLIFDGAEEADPEQLRQLLSLHGECGVMMTSRRQSDAPDNAIKLQPMPKDESVELLNSWAPQSCNVKADVEAIAALLGYLPLALCLVGRYLAQTGETAAEYLKWLRAEPWEALNPDDEAHRYSSVPHLLRRSLEQVDERAQTLLALAGQLALSPFLLEPLGTCLEASGSELKKLKRQLLVYGLLENNGDRLQIAHALIHRFASQQIPLDLDVWDRLVTHYINHVCEQTERGKVGYDVLDPDRAHLIALVERCQAKKAWHQLIELAQAVNQYLDRQGYWVEQQQVLEMGLDAATEQGDKRDQGWFCNGLALSWYYRGDYDTALQYLKQSLAIDQEIGDKSGEGTTINNISQIYDARGDYDTALQYLQRSLAIRQEIGDKSGEGTTLNNMATTAHARGDYDTALQYLKQSLAIQQEIGDKSGEGTTLNNISQIYGARGDYDTALQYLKQSLAIQQEIGDKSGIGATLNNMATTAHARGDYDTALQYLKQSLAIQQEIGDTAGLCATLFNIGHSHWQNEELQEAISAWLTVYGIAKKINFAQILHALESLAGQLGKQGGLEYWEQLAAQQGDSHSPSEM
jgi:tetratricopeptide (TPR) repeat protein